MRIDEGLNRNQVIILLRVIKPLASRLWELGESGRLEPEYLEMLRDFGRIRRSGWCGDDEVLALARWTFWDLVKVASVYHSLESLEEI